MKRRNTKLLTLMLAGALCSATLAGGAISLANTAHADDAPAAKKYAVTDVFESTGSAVSTSDGYAAFVFDAASDAVRYGHDLALAWHDENGAKGLSFTFAFKELNFADVSFVLETKSATATENDVSANTIKFVKKEAAYVVKVNDEEKEVTLTAGADVKVDLAATESFGEFDVKLNGTKVGTFTNIGANYADGDTRFLTPLEIKATPNAEATTTLLFKDLNGQSFAATEGKVTDNAKPIVVVENGTGGFLVGTTFDLEYEFIDVLDTTLTKKATYYQYNPTDTEIKYENSVTDKTKFAETVCYINANGDYITKDAYDALTDKTGCRVSTLFREEKKELVSIHFEVADDSHTASDVDLAWYVAGDALEVLGGKTYIIVDRNEKSPEYIGISKVGTENKADAALEGRCDDYTTLKLQPAADEIYAGSDAKLKLDPLDWLIKDNDGYKQLKFVISYKTPTSSTPTATNSLAYNKLEIPTTSEGSYEFKVFATDAAGNGMKYYLEGEEVELTKDNVWDIEEIPSFTFKVENRGLKTADGEDNDTLDSKVLDDTYTMSDVKILGANNKKSNYKLYKLDFTKYTGGTLTANTLSKVKFAALKTIVDEKLKDIVEGKASLEGDDYFELYKDAFAQALAKHLGVETNATKVERLADMFVEISAYAEGAPEETNKFNWNPSSKKFTAAESGTYIIIADYYDNELPTIDRVMAYQLIEVASEADVIKGETEWLKNNLVSVILFSVAGLMLILIIILLLIKPSDETLEDVEEKAAKKAKQKKEKKAAPAKPAEEPTTDVTENDAE